MAAVELRGAAFDPAAELAAFTAGLAGAGGVVSFTGHCRPLASDGAPLQALVLESYRGVTLASMQVIAEEAQARFAIARLVIRHREGRIMPGEAIVFVAAAAAHRRAAFEAADYMMDRLKTQAVFWKREETASGAQWIEPRGEDHADLARWGD